MTNIVERRTAPKAFTLTAYASFSSQNAPQAIDNMVTKPICLRESILDSVGVLSGLARCKAAPLSPLDVYCTIFVPWAATCARPNVTA
jgi:hypothetical protein